MLGVVIIAIAWPGAGSVEPLSRAFWVHQALAAAGGILFLRWVRYLAERSDRTTGANVIRFPRRT